jgi:multisubunit Na+/H+ antiporter MnhC subunit
MSDYQQKISGSFNERKRLIRLRRKKENLRFWNEFQIIPRWLVGGIIALFLIAQGIALYVNLSGMKNGGDFFPPGFHDSPVIASLLLALIITGISLAVSTWIFMIAYVNRDAKRRGMSPALWTLLVIILSGGYLVLGFMVYFLMREPLPYDCPQCGKSVGARFNFCPNCKCNLHPSCPNCKHEVVETDKFCPYCAYELGARDTSLAQSTSTSPEIR